MNNKKKNEGQTDFSYYGLYLLDYLRTNKFEQADDTAFIRERADRAAETYERARLEGYPADGAQELAMDTLLRGLHYSRYAILREVVENEFADEVPEEGSHYQTYNFQVVCKDNNQPKQFCTILPDVSF